MSSTTQVRRRPREVGQRNATALVNESDGPRDGKGDGHHELTGAKVRAGLQVLATKYPHHFADIVGDNSDCTTGDVLVQCALFGEIVYG
jgi:hypothetical protein